MQALAPFLVFGLSAVGMYLALTAVMARRAPSPRGLEGLASPTLRSLSEEKAADPSVRERLARATRWLRRYDLYRSTEIALARAGWSLKPVEFGLVSLVAALMAGGLAHLLTRQPALSAVVAAAAVGLAPLSLKAAAMQRMARFEADLPDALELMAASLRAGQGFQRALQVTAEDMPAPLSDEFRAAVQEINAGRTVEEALGGILQRVPSYEMELIATAVGIQMAVGGNLSEILVKIADTLRERARIKGEIKTLTAEGRLSAWILLLAPLAMFVFITWQNPDYLTPLVQEELGRYMLAGAAVLQVIGMAVIWRMLSMEV